MATFLYRIGRFSFERRKTVLLAWVLLLAVLGGLAGAVGKTADAPMSIPGVESVQATELLQDRFPGGAVGGATPHVSSSW